MRTDRGFTCDRPLLYDSVVYFGDQHAYDLVNPWVVTGFHPRVMNKCHTQLPDHACATESSYMNCYCIMIPLSIITSCVHVIAQAL